MCPNKPARLWPDSILESGESPRNPPHGGFRDHPQRGSFGRGEFYKPTGATNAPVPKKVRLNLEKSFRIEAVRGLLHGARAATSIPSTCPRALSANPKPRGIVRKSGSAPHEERGRWERRCLQSATSTTHKAPNPQSPPPKKSTRPPITRKSSLCSAMTGLSATWHLTFTPRGRFGEKALPARDVASVATLPPYCGTLLSTAPGSLGWLAIHALTAAGSRSAHILSTWFIES